MNRMFWLAAAGVLTAACTCPPASKPCTSSAECGQGLVCSGGFCRAGSGTGGGTGGGATGGSATGGSATGGGATGGGGGTGGTGGVAQGCDPHATDNATRDTDCDGISDADEYTATYGGGQKTDPCNADTDGDGIPDGVEVGRQSSPSPACTGFVGDQSPSTHTNPTLTDSDGDGLSDGAEDKNHNGRVDTGETDPTRRDTDCDGYSDKQELDGVPGCVTDPLKKDTDSDGLNDGIEGGLQPPGADPAGCLYVASDTFDADPNTKTNPCVADTDGDGIMDGAEDTNHNGRLDPGELNPLVNDSAGPAQAACSTANLKPVNFKASGFPDVQVALVPDFSEVSPIVSGGKEKGFIFFNPTTKVAGFAFSKTPVGANASTEELADRSKIGSTGNLTAPLVQTFTSWDGFGSAKAFYDLDGNVDVKTRLNAIAQAFPDIGAAATGLLAGTGGVTGPFKVQAAYVQRSTQRVVVIVAIIPSALWTGQGLFSLDDAAGGTSLAQFPDYASTQCEVFAATTNQKVDFLWVVDDSCSMASSQTAVKNASDLFANKLVGAGLDWRAGIATTGYYAVTSWNGSAHDFTTDIAVMKGWFDKTLPATWIGTGGSTVEEGFAGAEAFFDKAGPSGGTLSSARTDAQVHLIFMSDTADQSGINTSAFKSYLATKLPGQVFAAHGIICPEGLNCGDNTSESNPGKYHTVIRNTSGVIGNIMVFKPLSPTPAELAQQQATIDAIMSAVIGGTGHQLSRPPISSTIKVAMEASGSRGTCNVNDVPRDRTNGWDIDSATRRVVFYGNCIPKQAGIKVAVSYRYWIDNSPDPNGDPCGGLCQSPMVCDPTSKTCVCAPNCAGTCTTGLTCNMNSCTCDPGIN